VQAQDKESLFTLLRRNLSFLQRYAKRLDIF